MLDHLAKFEPKVARQLERETGLQGERRCHERRPASPREDGRGAPPQAASAAGLLRLGESWLYSAKFDAAPSEGAGNKNKMPHGRSHSGIRRSSRIVRQEEPAMQLTEQHLEYWSKNLTHHRRSCSSSGSW